MPAVLKGLYFSTALKFCAVIPHWYAKVWFSQSWNRGNPNSAGMYRYGAQCYELKKKINIKSNYKNEAGARSEVDLRPVEAPAEGVRCLPPLPMYTG